MWCTPQGVTWPGEPLGMQLVTQPCMAGGRACATTRQTFTNQQRAQHVLRARTSSHAAPDVAGVVWSSPMGTLMTMGAGGFSRELMSPLTFLMLSSSPGMLFRGSANVSLTAPMNLAQSAMVSKKSHILSLACFCGGAAAQEGKGTRGSAHEERGPWGITAVGHAVRSHVGESSPRGAGATSATDTHLADGFGVALRGTHQLIVVLGFLRGCNTCITRVWSVGAWQPCRQTAHEQ